MPIVARSRPLDPIVRRCLHNIRRARTREARDPAIKRLLYELRQALMRSRHG